jgi:hypothetical protein
MKLEKPLSTFLVTLLIRQAYDQLMIFDTLSNYPVPKNIKEIRGFFGIVTQCQWTVSAEARNELGKLHSKLKMKKT